MCVGRKRVEQLTSLSNLEVMDIYDRQMATKHNKHA